MQIRTQARKINYSGKGLQIGENGGKIKDVRLFTINTNPPSLTTGVGGSADLTVTGVAVGDIVLGWGHDDITDDYMLQACQVTAANTIRVRWHNYSGGTLDPGAINVYFAVLQRQV